MKARVAACKALTPVLKKEHSLQSSFEQCISQVDAKDKGLFHELVLGTLRKYELLDHIANQLLTKKLKRKDLDVYALILLGLYQLVFLRTPDHAAISETVSATKALKKPWAKNLVNAILRNFQREREPLMQAANSQSCLPEWLLTQLEEQWPEHWQEIIDGTQTPAPLCARINTQRQNLKDAQALILEKGLESELCNHSNAGLTIKGSSEITSLPGFKEGWLSIQDEAAQLAAPLLDLKPGMRVLDACAAPGGKTAAVLEHQPSIEELVALEMDEARVPRIMENLNRLKLKASIHTVDAGDLDAWWDGIPFDRILLDAPCSATGVIRRHPDIKLLRREDDLPELAAVQKMLLNKLWQTLKPGGILVYATCSILKTENEHQVAAFLKQNADAQETQIHSDWGEARPHGKQLFPKQGGHDGFYYAKLVKDSPE